VPSAKPFGKPAPLASLLGYIQDCVEYLQVRQAYVSTLHLQAIFDPLVLLFRDFHPLNILPTYCLNSVNTPFKMTGLENADAGRTLPVGHSDSATDDECQVFDPSRLRSLKSRLVQLSGFGLLNRPISFSRFSTSAFLFSSI